MSGSDDDEMTPVVKAAGNDPYEGPGTKIGLISEDVSDLFHTARLSAAVRDDPEDPEPLTPDRFLAELLIENAPTDDGRPTIYQY